MRAMTMEFKEAATEIGNSLKNLGKFSERRFHYPGNGRDVIVYKPGSVVLLVRWDGIAEDVLAEREGVKVPSAMRYELRMLHVTYAQSQNVDGYVQAQDKILEATGTFFESLNEDRRLNNLVLDTAIVDSFVGDLRDEVSGEDLYGHQINMEVVLFR